MLWILRTLLCMTLYSSGWLRLCSDLLTPGLDESSSYLHPKTDAEPAKEKINIEFNGIQILVRFVYSKLILEEVSIFPSVSSDQENTGEAFPNAARDIKSSGYR